jgi:hypothetical protein
MLLGKLIHESGKNTLCCEYVSHCSRMSFLGSIVNAVGIHILLSDIYGSILYRYVCYITFVLCTVYVWLW